MGRKKIQISRITDERNRQVSVCVFNYRVFFLFIYHICVPIELFGRLNIFFHLFIYVTVFKEK